MGKTRYNKEEEYLGKVYKLISGIEVKVIKYGGYHDVTVESLDEHKDVVCCEVSQLKRGNLKTPHTVVTAGVGFIGVGNYVPRPPGKSKTRSYNYWSNMLTRVYRYKNPAYVGVTVHTDWHNFQNYSEWFYSQHGHDKGWDVDKDLVGTGKLYSGGCCIMVPKILNNFASGIYNNNGCLPGIHLNRCGKYVAQMNNTLTGEKEVLGNFNNEENAFRVYKKRKELHLLELLDSNPCKDVPITLKERIADGFSIKR